MKKNKIGFTLVEVIVVLTILAIMAAVLIPTLIGYTSSGQNKKAETECLSCVSSANTLASEKALLTNDPNFKGDTDTLVGLMSQEEIIAGAEISSTSEAKDFFMDVSASNSRKAETGPKISSIDFSDTKVTYMLYLASNNLWVEYKDKSANVISSKSDAEVPSTADGNFSSTITTTVPHPNTTVTTLATTTQNLLPFKSKGSLQDWLENIKTETLGKWNSSPAANTNTYDVISCYSIFSYNGEYYFFENDDSFGYNIKSATNSSDAIFISSQHGWQIGDHATSSEMADKLVELVASGNADRIVKILLSGSMETLDHEPNYNDSTTREAGTLVSYDGDTYIRLSTWVDGAMWYKLVK